MAPLAIQVDKWFCLNELNRSFPLRSQSCQFSAQYNQLSHAYLTRSTFVSIMWSFVWKYFSTETLMCVWCERVNIVFVVCVWGVCCMNVFVCCVYIVCCMAVLCDYFSCVCLRKTELESKTVISYTVCVSHLSPYTSLSHTSIASFRITLKDRKMNRR